MAEDNKIYEIPKKIGISDDDGDINVGKIISWNDHNDLSNKVNSGSDNSKDSDYYNYQYENPDNVNHEGNRDPATDDDQNDVYTPKIDINIYKIKQDPNAKYDEINISEVVAQKMYKNLCVPSAMNAYSIGVEFFKQWVLNKFNDNYFKTIYVDGKHMFDEFVHINETKLIKKGKPAIGFFPTIDMSFDREGIDQSMHDLMYYARTFSIKEAFFKDKERHMYIALAMEMYLLNINVKIKVNTRSKQLDIAKYLKLALKVGATSGYYLDLDMHVPYEMLLVIAEEAGFEVDYQKLEVKEPYKFLLYLNSKSDTPFIYKLRSINGRNEYFIRVPNMYAHIRIPDLSIDDGERQNQVSSNFFVEFDAQLRMPAPKMYCLFNYKRTNLINFTDKNGNIRSYVANFTNVPTVNEKGWEQFVTINYMEEDRDHYLTLDLKELFKGDATLVDIVNFNKETYISPSTFIDFKLINHNKKIPYHIDWQEMTLTADTLVDYELSELVIYVDKAYLNAQTLNLDKFKNERVTYNTTTNRNKDIKKLVDPTKFRIKKEY